MTTAEHFRSAASSPTGREVSIAGVPWPLFKVAALVVGILVVGLLAAVTGSAATAVLGGAAVSTAVWLGAAITSRAR